MKFLEDVENRLKLARDNLAAHLHPNFQHQLYTFCLKKNRKILRYCLDLLKDLLTYFMPLVLGGIERDQWHEMG